MKKYKNILYMVDNEIIYYNYKREEIIKERLSNILKNGKVSDINLFIEKFNLFLKTNNLNNSIFGEEIHIIINYTYTKADKELLTNIFEKLNYRKINLINENKIYKVTNTKAFLNYNKEYSILNYIDKYKEIKFYFIEKDLFNKSDFIKFIKKKIKNKTLIIFGLNKDIESFIEEFSKRYKNEVFHYENDEFILINTLLEKQKYVEF